MVNWVEKRTSLLSMVKKIMIMGLGLHLMVAPKPGLLLPAGFEIITSEH